MSRITTIEELNKLIADWNTDPASADSLTIADLCGLDVPNVVIHISGAGQNSTIGTGLMKEIVRLNDQLYNMVKIGLFGSMKGCDLDNATISELEIQTAVKAGSSLIEILNGDAVKKAFEKMSGQQATMVIMFAILAGAFCFVYNVDRTSRKEELIEMQRTIQMQNLEEHDERLAKEFMTLLKGVEDSRKNTFSYLGNSGCKVKINGEYIEPSRLIEASNDLDGFDFDISMEKDDETNAAIVEEEFYLDTLKNELSKDFSPKNRKLKLICKETGEKIPNVRFAKELNEYENCNFIRMAAHGPINTKMIVIRDHNGIATEGTILDYSIPKQQGTLDFN